MFGLGQDVTLFGIFPFLGERDLVSLGLTSKAFLGLVSRYFNKHFKLTYRRLTKIIASRTIPDKILFFLVKGNSKKNNHEKRNLLDDVEGTNFYFECARNGYYPFISYLTSKKSLYLQEFRSEFIGQEIEVKFLKELILHGWYDHAKSMFRDMYRRSKKNKLKRKKPYISESLLEHDLYEMIKYQIEMSSTWKRVHNLFQFMYENMNYAISEENIVFRLLFPLFDKYFESEEESWKTEMCMKRLIGYAIPRLWNIEKKTTISVLDFKKENFLHRPKIIISCNIGGEYGSKIMKIEL